MRTELVTKIHNQAVELRVRNLLLNLLTVSSGAVDAISFLAPGKVFLGLHNREHSVSRAPGCRRPAPGAVAIVASVAAFAAGFYLSTRIIKPSEGSGMWPQRVTVAIGLSLIGHAVFLSRLVCE